MFTRRRILQLTTATVLLGPTLAHGATASEFALRNVNGDEVKLSDFKGQVVMLSFWATWCGPCKVEMKHLHGFHEELNEQGLTVLFISIDDARAAVGVKQYVLKNKYNKELFLLDKQSDVVGVYNPKKTVPFSVLIGRDGEIAKVWEGFNPGEEVHVKEEIVAQLEKPAPE